VIIVEAGCWCAYGFPSQVVLTLFIEGFTHGKDKTGQDAGGEKQAAGKPLLEGL